MDIDINKDSTEQIPTDGNSGDINKPNTPIDSLKKYEGITKSFIETESPWSDEDFRSDNM